MDVECEDFNGLAESNIGDGSDGGSNEKAIVETEESKISLPLDENNFEEENVGGVDKSSETAKPIVLPQKIENLPETTRNIDQVYENGKRKIKEEKPPTKVVVRRLPPSMTKETFLEQVSPLQSYDYVYFVIGDPSYGIHSFSRAYINFTNQEDLFTFTRTFDNYVFLDSKGQEYPAVVEFSPFQRVPKQRSKKKDTLTGSIESDPMYISFKENLLAEALENSKPGAKTMKQHYFETEISTAEEVNTTPLLEFLKQRRAEKARIRDERREEKKRKEAERKLKQKTKEKKVDAEEEETKDVKIQHCTVSAEKPFNKGEFKLLLKSEKEKVPEKVITGDEKERIKDLNSRMFTKESYANCDKIIIKRRREKNLETNVEVSTEHENINSPNIHNKTNINNTVNANSVYSTNDNNNNSNGSCVFHKHNEGVNLDYNNLRQKNFHINFEHDRNSFSFTELSPNNAHVKKNTNICGLKKAEQQTQYLRKILGLSSKDCNTNISDLAVTKTTTHQCNKASQTRNTTRNNNNPVTILTSENEKQSRNEPKIFVSSQKTLWCERNINPALPSASFKTSTNLNSNKNETEIKVTCSTSSYIDENNKKVGDLLYGEQTSQVNNRPFRGEIVIDKALSTNNVLPSAFRKTYTKDRKNSHH